MLHQIFLLIAAAVIAQAEPPARAPYAAAGWRPEVPFNLPGDFQLPVGASFEISKQRVEHAGTFNTPQLNVPRQKQQEQPEQVDTGNFDPPATPASEYGPPADAGFRIVYPEEDDSAALTQPQPKIKEGRYYIVSPDNKLQRVLYRTQEAKGDDFTAQLKYSSVGELQDPVYKYNSQGQLERVLK